MRRVTGFTHSFAHRPSPRRPGAAIPFLSSAVAAPILLFALAFLILIPLRPAWAQGKYISELVLSDSAPTVDAGPYAYVTPDPDRSISYEQLIQRFNSGDRGKPQNAQVINLGANGVASWIILVVRNASWGEDWMLSFGDRFDGRNGLLSKLLVFEHMQRTRYVDTITPASNPFYGDSQIAGSAVKMRLTKGQRSVIVIYAVPEAGVMTTITPKLIKESLFLHQRASSFESGAAMTLFLAVVVGVLLSAAIFGAAPGSLLMAGYFVIQLLYYHSAHEILLGRGSLSNTASSLIFSLGIFIALQGGRRMLGINGSQSGQYRLLFGTSLFVLFSALATLAVFPEGSPLRVVGVHMPAIASLLLLVLTSIACIGDRGMSAVLSLASWVVLLLALLIVSMAFFGMLPGQPVWFAAYWYATIVNGLLVIGTIASVYLGERQERLRSLAQARDDAETLITLRASKDAAENHRLKRLIEHERQVMNELREREVQQTEEMRAAKNAADEANRAKSAFLAVISHEIRTPMTGILGMVRLLLDTQLSRQQLEYSQTIQDSGDAMLALLNDILDFEKIESGKLDLEHVDFDLPRVLNGVVTLMSGHAAAKQITLKAAIDPNVPRYIIGDPIRLRQVLLNLVGNAIKFTQVGGVTVHVRLDPTADTRSGTVYRIRFGVEDTGVGIPKEGQKNLFSPFSQADSSITRKFGGTGLGLAISQRLIEAMGGRIFIDSMEGHGSTFFFTLIVEAGSAENAEGRAERAKPDATAPARQMRILVVEDNEINQKLLKEFIRRLGHVTDICGTGEDGVRAVEAQAYDVILMDVELPGISGLAATRAIRALKDAERASTPIVALTGNVRDDDIRACYAANMNAHLAKPVDPKRLQSILEKIGEGRLDHPVVLAEKREPPPSVRMEEPATARPDLPEKPELILTLEDEEDALLNTERPPTVQPDKAPASDKSIFDDAMLAGVKDTMKKADLDDMLASLIEKTDEIVGQLQACDLERDVGDITARAHELKGMAGNFGLKELSLKAADIEHAAQLRSGRAGIEIASLPGIVERARQALLQWAG